jgi:hypothetical protein
MDNKFNFKRYIELVDIETSLESQNKVFFEENKKQFLELLSYRADAESQMTYNRKNIYFSLIEGYLTKKLTPDEFRSKFLDSKTKDSSDAYRITSDLKQLSTFQVSSKATQFSSLILQVHNSSMSIIDLGPEDGLSETEFRALVKKTYSQLKDFLEE